MRYICFFEFKPEDIDKSTVVGVAYREEVAKNPEQYPKEVLTNHVYIDGYCKGFSVVEGDHEQIRRMSHFWFPEVKVKFIPVMEMGEKAMSIYQEIQSKRKQHGL